MTAQDIMDKLKNCDPESEVFIYEYDRGNPMHIEDVRTVNENDRPYDRNGFMYRYIEKHGSAVLISDWKW